MSEDQAIAIVQRHARYYESSPKTPYALRWPLTNPRCLFGESPRELVEKLLERENGKSKE